MATLSEEVRQVQNPALGAALLWRYGVGYEGAKKDSSGCPLPILFLVVPLLLHGETLAYVTSTQRKTGLRGFAAKFSQSANADSDILLALHERARALRELSLQSLRLATRGRLMTVDLRRGEAYSLTSTFPGNLAERVRVLARAAERIGAWCGDLTLAEVSSILRVRF